MALNYLSFKNGNKLRVGQSDFLGITSIAVYNPFINTARSLLDRFGVSVSITTKIRDKNQEDWEQAGSLFVYGAFVIKTSLSSGDENEIELGKLYKAKFLIQSNNIVNLGDYFVFAHTRYTIKLISVVNPGGITIIYKVLCS